MSTLRVDLLGGLRVRVGSTEVSVTSARQAALLACLALHGPRPVEVDTLIGALWGADPPGRPEQAVQQYVSALRALLEPARAPRRPAEVLLTEPAGYCLLAETDVADFARAVGLSGRLAVDGRPAESLTAVDDGLALWRGTALAGMPDTVLFNESRHALQESHTTARELRLRLLLDLGRNTPAVADAQSLLTVAPMREGVWARLIEALYRSGRTTDAFTAYDTVRRRLDADLGMLPGPELRQLHARMVRQDPALAGPPAPPTPAVPTVPPQPAPSTPLPSTFRVDEDALPWLEFRDGQRLVLPVGRHTVGRRPDNAVVLTDSRVSRVHAELHHGPGGVVSVRDCGSTNATFVNGTALPPGASCDLHPGDVLGVGGVSLTFHRHL